MLMAFSDEVRYIVWKALVSHISLEIQINSIAGYRPVFCGYAEQIIFCPAGCQGYIVKRTLPCNLISLAAFLNLLIKEWTRPLMVQGQFYSVGGNFLKIVYSLGATDTLAEL